MSPFTSTSSVSQAPTCTLHSQPSLLSGMSDHTLGAILPTLIYAVSSTIFYIFDELELFENCRIHPSKDELSRNRVTKLGCLKGVARYHIMQIGISLLLTHSAEPELVREIECETFQYASLLRKTLTLIPGTLTVLGLDAQRPLSVLWNIPVSEQDVGQDFTTFRFYTVELMLARIVVSIAIPILRFIVYLAVVDTWVYFTHRLCHINKTLYRIVHAQHHQLYVPYAYGAVYAHWLESLFLDILSFISAGAIAGISVRQGMVLSSLATFKTISDHCGYVFPLDPFSYVNRNGAQFHDLHHQSWGFKHNFSTYTVFWDKLLETAWTDRQAAALKYSRTQELVKARLEIVKSGATVTRTKSD
ncbi:sphinganine hydroxylase-like protein Sur2 [Amylocarpus encephaloides]|uniref:Sphinganine hydroxylase-like protein Sur2 n=1 Tax=Amylocarpus encephaloides TaxID=45428 RepID=A0A9P7YCK6_9HELO|nr:sphinganine hydroxylase-like protein Sur2 [Amylocarpus encephaloides]